MVLRAALPLALLAAAGGGARGDGPGLDLSVYVDDDFEVLDDEEFDARTAAADGIAGADASVLAVSFLEDQGGARAAGSLASEAAMSQRFGAEICRSGQFHEIQEAVSASTVEMMLGKEMMRGFIDKLLNGIVTIITDPISEILIKGILGSLMQLVAPFFVQGLLIAACAIIPGPVSDLIEGTLNSSVGMVTPNIIVMVLCGVIIARVMSNITEYIRTVIITFLENEVPRSSRDLAEI